MLEKVEKYWHEQNFKNRNEAIRDLVEKGLKKDDEKSHRLFCIILIAQLSLNYRS